MDPNSSSNLLDLQYEKKMLLSMAIHGPRRRSTTRARDHYPIKNRTSKIHLIQTLLNVADNSGARELMCIRIIGAGNHRYAHIGDVIVAVIKEAVPNMPLEREEVIRAVIVRTCKELKRDNGMIIRSYDNAAVVIDQEGKGCDRSGI